MATGKLITIDGIRAKLNRGQAWIDARMRAGTFPKPAIQEPGRPRQWDEAEIDRWIAGYVANFLQDPRPERW